MIAVQNNYSTPITDPSGSDARPVCIIDEHTTKTVFTIQTVRYRMLPQLTLQEMVQRQYSGENMDTIIICLF